MKRIFTVLLTVLLLLTLSACGQSQNGISYRPENENHYSAVHSIPRTSGGIYTAETANGGFYYITGEQVTTSVKTLETLAGRLAKIDVKSGELLIYSSLIVKLEEYAASMHLRCGDIIGIAVDESDNYSILMRFSSASGGYPSCYLLSMDAGFHVRWELSLSDLYTYYGIQSMILDAGGNTCVLMENGDFFIVDAQGNKVFEEAGGYHHMTQLSDGRVVLFL